MKAKHKRRHISLLVVFQYLLAICMVLNLRSMWLHSSNYKLLDGYRLLIIMFAVCVLCIVIHNKVRNKKLIKAFGVFFFTTVLVLVHILVTGSKTNILDELSLIITTSIVAFYHFSLDDDRMNLYEALSDVIYVISVISLLFWIFGSVLRILRPTGIIYTTWTATGIERPVSTYFNLYFEPQAYDIPGIGLHIVRNTSIFTEAPMYGYILSVGILIDLFIRKDTKRLRLMILAVSVASTFSTTAYIIVIIAFTLKFFYANRTNNTIKILKMFVGPVVLIVAVILVSNFLESKMSSINGTTRIDDFRAGYLAWKEAPIFGHGFANNEAYIRYISSFRINNVGMSNSVGLILVYGGLVLFVPYMLLMASGIKNTIKDRNLNKITFVILHSVFLLTTVVPFQAIPLYILIECADYNKTRDYSPIRLKNNIRIKTQVGEGR